MLASRHRPTDINRLLVIVGVCIFVALIGNIVFSALVAATTEQTNLRLKTQLERLRDEHAELHDQYRSLSEQHQKHAPTMTTKTSALNNNNNNNNNNNVNLNDDERSARNEVTSHHPVYSGAYRCREGGEFSGSWFITAQFFTSIDFWEIANVEGSTWTVMNAGQCHKTLDFLDFFVEHLSVYEQTLLWAQPLDEAMQAPLQTALEMNLERHTKRLSKSVLEAGFDPLLTQRVVALIPFFAGKSDAAHSMSSTRLAYLDATIDSVMAVFPHVVIGVLSTADRDLLLARRGQIFFDVLVVTDLIKIPDNLATATLNRAKDMLLHDERWKQRSFQHVYFSEADQVLRIRSLPKVISELYDRRILAPHRVMAIAFLEQTGAKQQTVLSDDLEVGSCCFVGKNSEKPAQHNFWYMERGFVDYKELWRQCDSLALMPGEQGNDKFGWLCALSETRTKCFEPPRHTE